MAFTFRYGTAAANTITADSGNDWIIFARAGNDTVTGSTGNDVVDGGAGADSIAGGDGTDVLIGGLGNDTLSGGADEDVIFGDAGNDRIDGGEDADSMLGGIGNDTFIFDNDSGDDIADGDDGTDIADFSTVSTYLASQAFTLSFSGGSALFAEAGFAGSVEFGINLFNTETVYASEDESGDTVDFSGASLANNTTGSLVVDLSKALQTVSGLKNTWDLRNFKFFENVVGSDFKDRVTGSTGANVIETGDGADTIIGSTGADTYDGGGGDDTLSFATFTTVLTYNAGDDELSYTSGNSTVAYDLDNLEVLIGGKGILDVFDGEDVGSFGFTLNLTTGSVDGLASGVDWTNITGFEIVYGSDGDDVITGNAAKNTIVGGTGDDSLSGGAADDTFTEGDDGTGSDTIAGGAGTKDTVNYGTNTEDYTLTLGTSDADLETGDETDTLTGIEQISLSGNNVGDTIDASALSTAMTFTLVSGKMTGLSAGANALTTVTGFENFLGGSGNDRITAGDTLAASIANSLGGGAGADTIDGGFGADTLIGHAGADSLIGGAGADELYGGADNDTMTGGADGDTYFMLNPGDTEAAACGTDVILDTAGTDELDISLWDLADCEFDGIDTTNDSDTKIDALQITLKVGSTTHGVVVIRNYFNNVAATEGALTSSNGGTGLIETILIGNGEDPDEELALADVLDLINPEV